MEKNNENMSYKEELFKSVEENESKNRILKKFKELTLQIEDTFFQEDGDKLLLLTGEILRTIKKEELTYEQAYAILQQVYNTLVYESNFTTIPSVK